MRKYGKPTKTKPTPPKPTTRPKPAPKPVVPKPKKKVCIEQNDELSQPVCDHLESNGLCWATLAKLNCWATCGVCNEADAATNDGDVEESVDEHGTQYIIKGDQAQVINGNSRKAYLGGFSYNKMYEGSGYESNAVHPGDEYYGTFKQGNFDGTGTYTYKNGDSYTGDFVDNSFSGTGTFI